MLCQEGVSAKSPDILVRPFVNYFRHIDSSIASEVTLQSSTKIDVNISDQLNYRKTRP